MMRRTFRAEVLGVSSGSWTKQVITFGDKDLKDPDRLDDPFKCLQFVENMVRKRHDVGSVEDFKVVMTELEHTSVSIIKEERTVRPWRYPTSENKYRTLG